MFIIDYYLGDQIRRMRRAGHVARMGKRRLQEFGGKIGGKVSSETLVEYLIF